MFVAWYDPSNPLTAVQRIADGYSGGSIGPPEFREAIKDLDYPELMRLRLMISGECYEILQEERHGRLIERFPAVQSARSF